MLTGIRVFEMCALTWKDIDFDNNVIHISQSITYTKNGENKYTIIIQAPKTISGIRTIPMFLDLKNILMQQKQSQKFFPPVSSREYSGFMFGNKNNHPYTAVQVECALKKIIKHYNEYEIKQAEAENREPQFINSCTPTAP